MRPVWIIALLLSLLHILVVPDVLAFPVRKSLPTFPGWRQADDPRRGLSSQRDDEKWDAGHRGATFIQDAMAHERQTEANVIRISMELPLLVIIIDALTDRKEIGSKESLVLFSILQRYGFTGPSLKRAISMQNRCSKASSLVQSRIVAVLKRQQAIVREHIQALWKVHVVIYFFHRMAPSGESRRVVRLNEERIVKTTNLYRQLQIFLDWYRRVTPR